VAAGSADDVRTRDHRRRRSIQSASGCPRRDGRSPQRFRTVHPVTPCAVRRAPPSLPPARPGCVQETWQRGPFVAPPGPHCLTRSGGENAILRKSSAAPAREVGGRLIAGIAKSRQFGRRDGRRLPYSRRRGWVVRLEILPQRPTGSPNLRRNDLACRLDRPPPGLAAGLPIQRAA